RTGGMVNGPPRTTTRTGVPSHHGIALVKARYAAMTPVKATSSASQCQTTRITGQINSASATRKPVIAPAIRPMLTAWNKLVMAEPTTAVDTATAVPMTQNAIFERRIARALAATSMMACRCRDDPEPRHDGSDALEFDMTHPPSPRVRWVWKDTG